MRTYISFCFLVNFFFLSFSQNVSLKGSIKDSIAGQPLAYANVIAESYDDLPLKFAIANENGFYDLSLEKAKRYRLTISFLGYKPIIEDVLIEKASRRDFLMITSNEMLDEVLIENTPPIIIKEDTLVYRTDVFKTGEERKLRDILKKLPGVQIDKEGNVTAMGKRVSKVLVEGEKFFTGSSKLAVNNIPSDAVDKIEFLDNYNEVNLLQGLEQSEELAMNVKLKEDKKKFAFGNIESGLGVNDDYLLGSNLFYYSPKTKINSILELNNVGLSSFTLNDYIKFNGGINKLFNDRDAYLSLYSDDFARFLADKDFFAIRNRFGALSINQKINSKIKLNGYVIGTSNTKEHSSSLLNNYISGAQNIFESRDVSGVTKNDFVMTKLSTDIKPDDDTDIIVETYLNISDSGSSQEILTASEANLNQIFNGMDNESLMFNQNFDFYKRLNKDNTVSATINFEVKRLRPEYNWKSNGIFLEQSIPMPGQDSYRVLKNKEIGSNKLNIGTKYYLELNRFNHIYAAIGSSIVDNKFNTDEIQVLDNNTFIGFSDDDFGNEVSHRLNDVFLGIEYKFKINEVTFKPGIYLHNYSWKTIQEANDYKKNKTLALPELQISFKSKLKNKVSFRYSLQTRFPDVTQLAEKLTVINFNSLYQGNPNIENEKIHNFTLNFNRFSILRNIFYNFAFIYRFKDGSIKNVSSVEGIDFITRPDLLFLDDKSLDINGDFRKQISNIMLKFKADYRNAISDNVINNLTSKNRVSSYSFGLGFETKFQKFPNVEINYDRRVSRYETLNEISEFSQDGFYASLEYDFLNNFILKFDYQNEVYRNADININNNFETGNFSLFYQKQDSPWNFELSSTNIFNNKFSRRNSSSEFIIKDERISILDRIVLFKIGYDF